MAVYFVDSSGVVKRYASEVGSAWIIGVTDPAAGNEIFVSRITGVEVVSALARRARSGAIDAADLAKALTQFRADFHNEYQLLETTAMVVERAMTLAEKHALRAYDALQLSAACELQTHLASAGLPPVVFIAADQALNAAASAEGLAVEDPNLHP